MDSMDTMDIRDIMEVMDIMDNMDIMDFLAFSALVLNGLVELHIGKGLLPTGLPRLVLNMLHKKEKFVKFL